VLRTKKNKPAIRHKYAEIWGLLLFGAAIVITLSLVDYDPRRNPLLRTDYVKGGYTGVAGTLLAHGLYLFFGVGAYVIPAFLFVGGIAFIIRKPPRYITLKVGYMLLMVASVSCIAELQRGLELSKSFPFLAHTSFGGALGERLGRDVLIAYLGTAGGGVVAVMGFVVSAMLLTHVEFYPYARMMGRAGKKTVVFLARLIPKGLKAGGRGAKRLLPSSKAPKEAVKEERKTIKPSKKDSPKKKKKAAQREVAPPPPPPPPPSKPRPPRPTTGEYRLPPIELLNLPSSVSKKTFAEDLKKNAGILEQTFSDFGIKAHVGEIQRGPVITRYEVHPAPGVKVTRIASLADDIALAMRVAGIRVTPPIPGKGAIGVEIPNSKATLVSIREVLSSEEFASSKAIIPVGIGKSVAGKVEVADLTEMPHLLIAGATGSGKSVCINSILTTLLYKARPDELKLLIVDPKKIELGSYNGLPHLLVPVVTNAKKVAQALTWLVTEMERRYDYLSKAGMRNIASYNARPISRSSSDGDTEIPDRLPYIVTIIDELADLMMVSPVDIEMSITRLAQLSRSVGIHLIIATQRPSVNVITGVIKANFPARISFQVASKVDSRTVIDANGAETLVGNGDLLFMPPGTSKLIRAQGTYVDDAEIRRVVQFVKDQAGPDYQDGVLAKESKSKEEEDDEEPIEDELFDQAVEIILRTGQASASNLQRKMKIGYARAGRIIDMMEMRGIVGPADGSKPRKILMGSRDD
jgi:S-DNA-T family DNA segregation ATPase FtsK/SpoIIIE